MATPFEIRAELIDLVSRDLLGPAKGLEEELDPQDSSVTRRYLLGALAPGGKNTLGETGSDTDADESGDTREAEADTNSMQVEDGTGEAIEKEPVLVDSLLPSSAGFSCLVDPDETMVLIRCAWGRYEKSVPEEEGSLPVKKGCQ